MTETAWIVAFATLSLLGVGLGWLINHCFGMWLQQRGPANTKVMLDEFWHTRIATLVKGLDARDEKFAKDIDELRSKVNALVLKNGWK